MMLEEASDNAHIINAGSGKNIPGNSQNAEDVEEQNTAAKNVKRVHGYFIDIGVFKHLNDHTTHQN